MKLKYAIIAFILFIIIGAAYTAYQMRRSKSGCITYYGKTGTQALYKDCSAR